MTTFTIPAETYLRLAGVAVQPDEQTERAWLRCVRIEHRAGKAIALASNSLLIAGEFIGTVESDDATVCLAITPALIEMARVADTLTIAQAPGWTVVTTDAGAMYPGNGEIDGSGWHDWRTLIPADVPTKTNGCFSFGGVQMARLCASAPSGSIRLPKHVDASIPIIVRDTRDENWFGIFMVSDGDYKQSFKPATVPEWLR